MEPRKAALLQPRSRCVAHRAGVLWVLPLWIARPIEMGDRASTILNQLIGALTLASGRSFNTGWTRRPDRRKKVWSSPKASAKGAPVSSP
jgi:hypothetical protein